MTEEVNEAIIDQANKVVKKINESLAADIKVEQAVSDGIRTTLVCSINDSFGVRRFICIPCFDTVYSASEWARRDLCRR